MAEPLKNMYDRPFFEAFAEKIKPVYPAFDSEAFVSDCMGDGWESLELKERIRRISVMLGRHLPGNYNAAIAVLLAVSTECTGFAYLFFPDFVEVFGMQGEHWNLSMKALESFTPKSSAEFAVRPFLLNDPGRMMEQMTEWARHPDEHVRRLASEGCRPRLPWGQSLPVFKRDPAPVLALLETLKADPSLYVRKSVANNLNDIAKDHPGTVIETARRWKGSHPHTDWIIRHGCRTLVRKAIPEALELFGYAGDDSGDGGPLIAEAQITVLPGAAEIGGECELTYSIRVRNGEAAKIRIEYGIYFVKSGGKSSRKLFLLSDKQVSGGTVLTGSRRHRWADLTTRRHYPGVHRMVLVVNGREIAETSMMLEAAPENG